MHVKKDFNFFFYQDTKKAQSQLRQLFLLLAGAAIVVAGVMFFLWSRSVLDFERAKIEELKARTTNPEVLAALQEIDVKRARIDSLAQYKEQITRLTTEIDNSKMVSTYKLEAFLKLIPASIDATIFNINGSVWQVDCSTPIEEDIAIFINAIEESPDFQNAAVGSIIADEEGNMTFSLVFSIKGGIPNELE